jgi:nicotinamidase/pyrazinamidase
MRRYHKDRFGRYQFVIATKDFHLPGDSNGGHFSDDPDYVTTWPEHCVQGTEGSMLHPAVADAGWVSLDAVFYKGQGRPDYSGFQGRTPTLYDDIYLLEWLNDRRVTELDIVGVATDRCVKATAMDAIENGFIVRIPQQLTLAVGGNEARDQAIRQVMWAQGKDGELIN